MEWSKAARYVVKEISKSLNSKPQNSCNLWMCIPFKCGIKGFDPFTHKKMSGQYWSHHLTKTQATGWNQYSSECLRWRLRQVKHVGLNIEYLQFQWFLLIFPLKLMLIPFSDTPTMKDLLSAAYQSLLLATEKKCLGRISKNYRPTIRAPKTTSGHLQDES